MTRGTGSSFNNALDDTEIHPALLVEIEFDGGYLRLWTGYGDFTYDSNTYTGTGNLASVSPIREVDAIEAVGIQMALSGLPPAIVSQALGDARQGKEVAVHLALFQADGTLIEVADSVFKGLLDVPTIRKGHPTSDISITAENRLIELRKANARRYTDEDQKELFPGDKGLEYVVSLQNKEITWGKGLN